MAKLPQDPPPGTPIWMLTFSDCMTLLLTFFVLLMSFSSFDDVGDLKKLTKVFNERFPSLGTAFREPKDAFLGQPMIHYEQQLNKGSEKPTLEQGTEDNLKKESSENFRDKKVFVADSARIFWGNSMMLSKNGERIMSILADFIKQVPNNIIISERQVQNNDKNFSIGQERAWIVVDYLCKKYGISYDRFMISSGGTIDNISSDKKNGRMVEIVLLERSFVN